MYQQRIRAAVSLAMRRGLPFPSDDELGLSWRVASSRHTLEAMVTEILDGVSWPFISGGLRSGEITIAGMGWVEDSSMAGDAFTLRLEVAG